MSATIDLNSGTATAINIAASSHGIDGTDHYYRITVAEGVGFTAENVAEDYLAAQWYESERPGGWFCHGGLICPVQHHDDQFIVIVQHRRDI